MCVHVCIFDCSQNVGNYDRSPVDSPIFLTDTAGTDDMQEQFMDDMMT